MSQVTTTPLKVAPAAASHVSLSSGGSAWANGAWVQVLAATGGVAAAAGLTLAGTESSIRACEVDVGMGAAGSEVVVTTLRVALPLSTNLSGPHVYWFPNPVTGIAAGVRLALRQRGGNGATLFATLLYYETLDATNSTTLPGKSLPSAADNLGVTPNATAWAASGYVQVTSGLGVPIAIHGLTCTQPLASIEGEWDIATGGAGAEVVLTTVRFATGTTADGAPCHLPLPAPYPIAASTRLAVQLRKSGTSTTAFGVALLYDEFSPAPAPVTGSGDVTVSVATLDATGTVVAAAGTGALTIGAPALAASGLVTAPTLGTGGVAVGVPALDGTGVLLQPLRVTQLLAEVLALVPPSPLAASHLLVELVLAHGPQPDQARVTQLCCELIVVPRQPVCPAELPLDANTDPAACADDFPLGPVVW
jgi:hypothetical protein